MTTRSLRLIATSIIAALCLQFSFAQTAPDFQVTDSQGNEHQLYADYLDQGKTVMIKIFFTTCPPCNAIAGYMEEMYIEWGSGDHDVEFFELSDKSFDTDELVNNYKAVFGQTFPGVGSEGGSLDAVVPYKNGTFGQFWGTPTFIVISPDGTVNFNVSGPNTQGTLAAIDAAIAATGAEKPEDEEENMDTIAVAGKVEFYYTPTGIANVRVALVNVNDHSDVLAFDSTDTNGEFLIEFDSSSVDLNQYEILPTKTNAPKNGVSGVDLIIIQKHILGIAPLTEVQNLLAMEANLNAGISALDIIKFLKIMLGETPNFPDNRSWLFYSADGTLSTPESITQIETVSLSQALIAPEDPVVFKAIKRGDLNHNADPLQ